MRWLHRILITLPLLVVLLVAGIYLALRGSLARLEGEAVLPGAGAPVVLTRDARGYLDVQAQTRIDAARALGHVHAQERFFQMDLLRRNSAGELSALVGAKALPLDRKHRMHRFRMRAERAFAAMPEAHRRLLQAYAEGVNQGLSQLAVRPFEYLLLRQVPQSWKPEEALLANFSMYLDLQGASGFDDITTGTLRDAVSEDWYRFLTQHSDTWAAALDGSTIPAVPVPDTPWPFAQRRVSSAPNPGFARPPEGVQSFLGRPGERLSCSDCTLTDSRDIGSNNWAVGALATADGRAILADDMHLGIRVPSIWFKTRLAWREEGQPRHVAGVSLPGTPAVVAGSNGAVAWGFTNATADWADVVVLKTSSDGQRYLTPEGEKPFTIVRERIEVAGEAPAELELRETQWGPVLPAPWSTPGRLYALRWVAHDVQAINMRLFDIERARSVDEVMRLAAGTGIPAQNIVVADAQGHIGWSIAGAIPRRRLASLDLPQDWSDGRNRWDGYVDAAGQPRVVDPPDARLWTANNRVVGGDALALIGNGNYDLGARAQQIRDGLRAKPKLAEADLHAIQLDDRALMLQRWRTLLLDEVLTPAFVAAHGLAPYRKAIETRAERAGPGQVGYTLVRAFRERVLEQLFSPIAGMLEERKLSIRELKFVPENPGWLLVRAKRADTLPRGMANWQAFLEDAVIASRDATVKQAGSLEAAGWAEQNRGAIRHPLSGALPFAAPWLDMPPSPQSGDRHMPRVAQPVHGQSERMVVSPAHEDQGILVTPAGQSGHPLSPFYAAGHADWLEGKATPFLPGPAVHRLVLTPP